MNTVNVYITPNSEKCLTCIKVDEDTASSLKNNLQDSVNGRYVINKCTSDKLIRLIDNCYFVSRIKWVFTYLSNRTNKPIILYFDIV